MVSALAEAKQFQEILSEYHEDTHIILETDSSAAKANAERPGCGTMKHISVKYKYLQDATTNQEVWPRSAGTKHNVADGLTKTVNQHVVRNTLTTLKIELLETSKEQLSINLIDCKNKLMGAEDSDAGSPGRQSKYWTQEDPDAFPRGRESSDAGSPGRQSKCWTQEHRGGLQRKQEHRKRLPRKQEHREGLPRNFEQEHREGLQRKLKQQHREGLPRKLEQEHRERLPRNLKQEHRERLPRKLKQEHREGLQRKLKQQHREGLPRKFEQEHRERLPRNLKQEHRERLPIKLKQEDREGWPRKLAQEDREGLPRTVEKFDAGSPERQSKHWAHDHCDRLFGKIEGYRVILKRERAELREGLPGEYEKVVTHEQKQIEKVVTHKEK